MRERPLRFPLFSHAPIVVQLPRLVLVKVVDQLLNVQREAKVLLDDFYEAVALHKAAQVGLPAAGDEGVDCGGGGAGGGGSAGGVRGVGRDS